MKFKRVEVEKRAIIKANRTVKTDEANGIMAFGIENDYPQIIERIILGSTTAKAVAGIYAKFLCGLGFSDEVNNQVIGKDQFGKDVTVYRLLASVCHDLAYFGGGYIHRNVNRLNETGTVKRLPFKFGRLSIPDDSGYFAKILFNQNWEKDADSAKYDKNKTVAYHTFNRSKKVLNAQMKEVDGDVKAFKGQVYPLFLDTSYIYPLSPFDSVYLDADSENELSVFKNRQLRNGMAKKTVFVFPESELTDNSGNKILNDNGDPVVGLDEEIYKDVSKFLGPDGDSVLVVGGKINQETGLLDKSGTLVTEQLESSIQDETFKDWPTVLSNNIRKAAGGMPAILIDTENNSFGTTSGEALKEAVKIYNAITAQQRALISEAFKDILSLSANPVLKNNQDWAINELELLKDEPTINTATASNQGNI